MDNSNHCQSSRPYIMAVAGLMLLGLQACSLSLPATGGNAGDIQSGGMPAMMPTNATASSHDNQVATDLIASLRHALPPASTIIQIDRNTVADTRRVAQALSAAGYALQLVDGDVGPHVLRVSRVRKIAPTLADSRTLMRFGLRIGAVSLRRSYYYLPANEVVAAGPLHQRGAALAGDVAAVNTSLPPVTTNGQHLLGKSSRTRWFARERHQALQKIAVNLVGVLVQLPGHHPSHTTLQFSAPRSAFGKSVIRALQDAGYALRHVPADQGTHYVSYSERSAETEIGKLRDFSIGIGALRVTREYTIDEQLVFPTSMVAVKNSDVPKAIQLRDQWFLEQGGDVSFMSGVYAENRPGRIMQRASLQAQPDNEHGQTRQTPPVPMLDTARRHQLDMIDATSWTESAQVLVGRVSVIFDRPDARWLGIRNKRRMAVFVQSVLEADQLVIEACDASHGLDPRALARGHRVLDELAAYGIRREAVVMAPCQRANYRHVRDGSPISVDVLQFRSERA